MQPNYVVQQQTYQPVPRMAETTNGYNYAQEPSYDEIDNPGGGGDNDADEARYCYCNGVSYGQMIGCDDEQCQREWFHIGCVGLDKPPSGNWICEECAARRKQTGTKRRGAKKVLS